MVPLEPDGAVGQTYHALPHSSAEIIRHVIAKQNRNFYLLPVSNNNVFELSEIIENNIIQVQVKSSIFP